MIKSLLGNRPGYETKEAAEKVAEEMMKGAEDSGFRAVVRKMGGGYVPSLKGEIGGFLVFVGERPGGGYVGITFKDMKPLVVEAESVKEVIEMIKGEGV